MYAEMLLKSKDKYALRLNSVNHHVLSELYFVPGKSDLVLTMYMIDTAGCPDITVSFNTNNLQATISCQFDSTTLNSVRTFTMGSESETLIEFKRLLPMLGIYPNEHDEYDWNVHVLKGMPDHTIAFLKRLIAKFDPDCVSALGAETLDYGAINKLKETHSEKLIHKYNGEVAGVWYHRDVDFGNGERREAVLHYINNETKLPTETETEDELLTRFV